MIVVCSLYFPEESDEPSWASRPLSFLRYNSKPEIVQALIRGIHVCATDQIKVPGVEVRSLPLYEALDPRNPGHYVARVEPSIAGGKEVALLILKTLDLA